MTVYQKVTHVLLYALMFITPLLLVPTTSEAFEFPKLVLVYGITILAISVWIGQSIASKRIIFKRTPLDIPLALYLVTLTISTILSIDPISSVFGTYGRFNGGLLSQISYALLYWIFVSLVAENEIKKSLSLLLSSAVIVSAIAIIEHFGFSLTCFVMTSGEGSFIHYLTSVDTSCWTQDFQTRVFSTIGQPNWLAAWLVALSPFVWHLTIRRKSNAMFIISLLFATAIIFTKSRSGYLGLVAALVSYAYLTFRSKISVKIGLAVTAMILFVGGFLIVPRVLTEEPSPNETIVITDSGTIRTTVWKSALAIWNDYKLFGSGPETFYLMFPRYKLQEFNETSEWDFVFNKSHNQYLDILANTGTATFIAYLLIVGVIVKQALISKSEHSIPVLSGYISLLITNAFGFAVVPTSLLMFLFPLVLFAQEKHRKENQITPISASISLLLALGCIKLLTSYVLADVWYKNANEQKLQGDYDQAAVSIKRAHDYNPFESLYVNELADIEASLAVDQSEQSNEEAALRLANNALTSSQRALEKSPHNHLYLKKRASILIRMAGIDPTYIQDAHDILELLTKLLPHDPEIHFNYALLQVRTGQSEDAYLTLEKTIQMKLNYKNPRLLRAELLLKEQRYNEAREELEYIRKYIDPFDETVNKLYESI